MARESFKASAPGSLMLLGEHAVLYGRQALVCAVNRRIYVTLIPRKDTNVRVVSSLGEIRTSLKKIKMPAPFRFVQAALNRFQNDFESGFDLKIESDFSHEVGLGSSAAVTVATYAALMAWLERRIPLQILFQTGVNITRKVQGLGSGADVAASVFGGIVAYRMDPVSILKLERTCPITVIYSGHKTPTVTVVRRVQQRRRSQPLLFDSVFDLMHLSAGQAIQAIRARNWKKFGQILDINQGLMDAIGANEPKLAEIVFALRNDPGILGAKISGSGLGDCAIGLGKAHRSKWPYPVLPVAISQEGVRVE